MSGSGNWKRPVSSFIFTCLMHLQWCNRFFIVSKNVSSFTFGQFPNTLSFGLFWKVPWNSQEDIRFTVCSLGKLPDRGFQGRLLMKRKIQYVFLKVLNFFFNHLHVSRKLLILNFQNLETFPSWEFCYYFRTV